VSLLAAAIAIAGFVAVVAFGRGVTRRRYTGLVLLATVGGAALAVAADLSGHAAAGSWTLAAVAWLLAAWLVLAGLADRRRWLAAMRDPLVLGAPFTGRWRVVAGGPWARDNHHLVASDQLYAYDFVRTDDASLGTPILAPASGVVVGMRDEMPDRQPRIRVYDETERPFGNYVAIDAGRGIVMLCHLQRGSVRVRIGDTVRSGEEVGRCGNSGRTTRPHLHLHAQDRPEEAPFVARGVPIAFRDRECVRVLNAGQRLGDDAG
jgi:murein DD-endopeptidase MepM/ murein hydrolase activator NlpD